MSHDKRIHCDFDDTISFTLNRDWKQASPNQKVIDKLNFFYDSGWEIYIVTARGQLSCKGDPELAEQKYGRQIELWLKRHGVKYHKLSFQKYLATYYIDDKALTPEAFCDLEYKRMYGMSGSYVIKQGDKVSKTAINSKSAILWYDKAKELGLHVPEIYKLIGNTITMEYINTTRDTDVISLCNVIDSYKTKPLNKHTYKVYVQRVESHLENENLSKTYLSILDTKKMSDVMNNNISFCHGDSAIDNFITRGDHIYFIDPIYSSNDFTSWLLDVSKLLMSLNRFGFDVMYDYVSSRYSKYPMKELELSHWIRFHKYTDNKEVCKAKMEELYNAC
jgi:capsule biosynthesis phosphatase